MSGRALSDDDARFMRQAIGLARRGLGQTWPNPSVGCLIVQGGQIVGRGWTQKGGRPHAEAMALAQAHDAARGATAYVTLEPCAHHGATPPCADALIGAGVARVVVACIDPDPRTAGQGIQKLQAGGLVVAFGLMEQEAKRLNAGFMRRIETGLPWVTWKTATSLDGRIALHNGESRWITGAEARRHVHHVRARHDAILTGVGTVLADDPLLSVRFDGYSGRQPLRIVMDSRLRTPLTSNIVRTARDHATQLFAIESCDPVRRRAFEETGVAVRIVGAGPDYLPDPAEVLRSLAADGVTRVLLEAGGRLSAAFLQAGLIDEIYWYRAGTTIGGDGIPAIAPLGVDRLADVAHFLCLEERPIGSDRLAILQKAD